ncbi:acetyl-CoA carboxylase biotin carboxyl carrier protein [Evansella cellulosilytica]|uniref:Biotin carboxyl carrier protein of acetyl-CoA carboxylase n=1 Tax=Evansella cellulosilytica (strain ATCC 21833 / DSM 2522 / FERM P-1141 / JCM 9156 / N-4) TaxID=649639 RepID=E6TXP7_EVAC2|nr:acetyl-CoA carboxylase biotin carboxyl carrier protein [Evansella cellulosilytica]ADU29973.1 acetyl-CoA carboxylase, biotin carboxyl carrier protein [Evansella cellulosilytica DSM 2522]
MLKIQEIRELIKLIDESSIEEFKFEQEGSKVTLRKQIKRQESVQAPIETKAIPNPTVAVEPATITQQLKDEETKSEKKEVAKENVVTITSPMVGTFYEAPSPESSAYVKVGDKVNKDTVVCIVEAMKLMNEIEAEINGEIVEVLVENGQLVEYGQELFVVKPE